MINGQGQVFVFWNTTLLPVSNFTNINTSGILIGNTIAPSLLLTIKPGQIDSDMTNFVFNYSVTAFDTRSLTIQLHFENPAAISKSQNSIDTLVITFNDASYFIS